MKECIDCKEPKPLTEFYTQKNSKDGRRGMCKKCSSIRCAKYFKENPHKRQRTSKESQKSYYENNKEAYLIRAKEQHEKGGDAIKQRKNETAKAWHQKKKLLKAQQAQA